MAEQRSNLNGMGHMENMSFSERLAKLDEVEKSIVQAMQSAGQCLAEIAKDKTATRQAEGHAQEFSSRLQAVEKIITAQISYLSEVGVGAAHESSAYSQLRGKLAAEEKVNYVNEKLAAYRRNFNDVKMEAAPSGQEQ